MYSSNQILVITGDKRESLKKAIEFALEYDGHKPSDMRGVAIKDNSIIFGWIPKKGDKYKKEYIDKWDETFVSQFIDVNIDFLIDVIYKFLKSDEIEKEYDRLLKEGVYSDCFNKGWKLTGFDDFRSDYPTFSTIKIEPFLTEYDD